MTAALDLLEGRALRADRVDWPVARTEVLGVLDDPEQLELKLFHLVRQAGGPHGGVRRARPATGAPDLPRVEAQGEALVVTLPACAEHAARAYADAARAALDGRIADRWIVDLRGTGGGSPWPLLAAVAPLLGEGEVGAFVDREGGRTPWTVRDGVVSRGATAQLQGPSGRLDGPVSVLTDGNTANSGEAVAVAFRGRPDARSYGAPTLGFSTGVESAPLPGGLVLTVATSRFADRTGQVYGGPVAPDVPSDDPLSMALWDL
ncbi:S41 family peptidase [Pseudonocardia sp. RS11V-5]|uniref:S41 family peptidase n=1 Tax=Pseudonocardia terrae TaxID=2905831 RepID=UPI001E4A9537|nr:S41 family peptidase [Pseudonocardia terrae]MCE3552242.1 S41 family peptidase [Pseudonocardia terrae]